MTTVKDACQNLLEIAAKTKPEDFFKLNAPTNVPATQYDLNRLWRTVHGLQMIIWLNGGIEPHTWLPTVFDSKNYGGHKIIK